ncbi:MAG: hypothetical protein OEM41_10245 [Ignavibacteria bacterium]|nr:hypothetical protein [Ignavibacteria bacterium]
MKNILVVVFLASFVLLILHTVNHAQQKATVTLQSLGIPEQIAKESIWNSFSGGFIMLPPMSRLKQLARGDRAAAVREIAGFARKYSESDDFRKIYLRYREDQKPNAPEAPKSADETQNEMKEGLKNAIREMEQTMSTLPADQRQMMKETIEGLKQQLKEMDTSQDPEVAAQMDMMNSQFHKEAMAAHEEDLKRWEKEYPLNPTPMIRKWLAKFLEVSKGVDFGAQVRKDDNGKFYFVKSEYERKSSEWKMCFRAGKEAVEAGRASATEWLAALQQK